MKTLSEAAKIEADAAKVRREAVDTANIDAAIVLIKSASSTIKEVLRAPESDFSLSEVQKKSLEQIDKKLVDTSKSRADPNKNIDQSVLDVYATNLVAAAVEFEKVSANLPKAANDKFPIASIPAEVKAAAGKIASKPAAAPVFDLYEVNNSTGKTELRKVPIP